MKVALVHDHLAQDGGAERVLRVFQDMYPDAPTFTLLHDPNTANPAFANKDIRTSFLQRVPLGLKKYQWYFPLMPLATERHDVMEYDVVLSSTSAFSKGVITKPGSKHFCYCHTPTRYLWTDTHSYVDELRSSGVVKKIIPAFFTNLRLWDRLAADRVDFFIANSKNVQERIKKYYRRRSDVIYPPVDIARFRPTDGKKSFYLTGGRLVSYKRFDITIQAFNRLGLPLIVFGSGPEFDALKKMAKPHITFLGAIPHEEIHRLYAEAIAFIHPHEEDFGLTAIESMAAGRPVFAYAKGGALESVVDGQTGVHFHEQTWEDLADKILRFKPEHFDPQQIHAHAQQFSVERFEEQIKSYIEARI